MQLYAEGLLRTRGRKSLRAMAQVLADCVEDEDAIRQKLQQLIGQSEWSDAELGARIIALFKERCPADAVLFLDEVHLRPERQRRRDTSNALAHASCSLLQLRNETAGVALISSALNSATELLEATACDGRAFARRTVVATRGYGMDRELRAFLFLHRVPFFAHIDEEATFYYEVPDGRSGAAHRREMPAREIIDYAAKQAYVTRLHSASAREVLTTPGWDAVDDVLVPAVLCWTCDVGEPPSSVWLAGMLDRAPAQEPARLVGLYLAVCRNLSVELKGYGYFDYAGRSERGLRHHVALCMAAQAYETAQRWKRE
jgi:hypothetical protein